MDPAVPVGPLWLAVATRRDAEAEAIFKRLRSQSSVWRNASWPSEEHINADVLLFDWPRNVTRRSDRDSLGRPMGARAALVALTPVGNLQNRTTAARLGALDILTPEDLMRSDLSDRLVAAIVQHRTRNSAQNTTNWKATYSGLGRVEIDAKKGTIVVGGRVPDLTPQLRRLMFCLASAEGRDTGATALCSAVGIQPDPDFRNLRNQVCRLRKRLGSYGAIVSGSPMVGYRLVSHIPRL